jgi:hypothetical protein
MRFMVMVKASQESEAGQPPPTAQLDAMTRYNDELVKAGVLLDANGLAPSSEGALVRFTGGEPTVIDGPFAEAKELVAGYWLIEVKSHDEAVEWVKRIPCGATGADFDVELRPLFEADDFGDGFTDDIRERQERMAAKIAERHG